MKMVKYINQEEKYSFPGSWALPAVLSSTAKLWKNYIKEVKEETGILIEISELVGVIPIGERSSTQLPVLLHYKKDGELKSRHRCSRSFVVHC